MSVLIQWSKDFSALAKIAAEKQRKQKEEESAALDAAIERQRVQAS